MKLFDASVYASRRKALMQRMGSGIFYFPGAIEQPFNYKANPYPFRQNSHFLYYFGISLPGLGGIIDADTGESILIGHDADLEEVIWMGPQPSMEERIRSIGADRHITPETAKSWMHGKAIQYLPPYHADRVIHLTDVLGKSVDEVVTGFSQALVDAVIAQRAYKSAEEVAQMEEAVAITGVMHAQINKSVAAGKYEAHLRGIAEGIALANQGRLSYGAICTVQGQTLHNNEYHRLLHSGQLLLVDMGAENRMGYAGDITRTFPVDKSFTSQQAAIYDLVLKAEEESIQVARPGMKYLDVHLGAARIIADGLKDIGLMKGDMGEAVAAGAHALFFPHGLGHMIGLDVHDMEDLGENNVGYDSTVQRSKQFGTAYLRMARALEPGFVVTVEPGIYFIPELIDSWKTQNKFADFIAYEKLDAYRNFGGIRIEDNVLVTDTGVRVLGPPIAKARKAVERS